jgi:hypothetical protein
LLSDEYSLQKNNELDYCIVYTVTQYYVVNNQ